MSINDDAPCRLKRPFLRKLSRSSSFPPPPPLPGRPADCARGHAASYGQKSGEFINQAEKVISQMIFVAEIMNTLPFSDSLALSIPLAPKEEKEIDCG